MHEIYGEQVTYKELKGHVKNNLSRYKADIVNHFLKKYVKKENCRNNISDDVLIVVYEAMRKLD